MTDLDVEPSEKSSEKFNATSNQIASLLKNTSEAILVVQNHIIQYANQVASQLLQQPAEELVNLKIETFINTDDRNQFLSYYHNCLADKGVQDIQVLQILQKNGSMKWVEIRAFPMNWGTDRAVAFYFNEISKRKQTEEALRDSEAMLKSIVSAAPVGIGLVSNRIIKNANEQLCRILGYSEEELIDQSARILYPTQEEFEWVGKEKYEQIQDHGTGTVETRWKRKDGHVIFVLLSSTPIDPNDLSAGVTFTALDITDRKQVEKKLRRLAKAIDQTDDSVIITDRKGIIIYVNPAFEKISGFSKDEITGQNIRMLKSDKHDDSFYRNMWETISVGRVWTGHIINRMKDGNLCEFETTISPIRDKKGHIENFVSVNRDVTHEVKLKERLLQAQKMEAIGTLAGGIAHDFNNILSAVIGYAELASQDVSPGSLVFSNIQKVLNAGERARDLVKQILAFSRQSELEPKPVQIKLVVKEALKLIRASLPTTIDIQQDLESEASVIADPTQIHQVIMNLCTNAGHSMREVGGTLSVDMSDVILDQEFSSRHPDIIPGPYIKMSVKDTGYGILPEHMDRIFDPFFTTKEKGEGTGMGLSVVHGIISNHGGTILPISEVGRGTQFDVYLPIVDSDLTPQPSVMLQLPKGSERILFVDDEEFQVDLGKQIFERLGYKVDARASSIDAFELFRLHPHNFDLVITDMTMPNMTGDILAKRMLEIRPDIPIIICTGYSERITEEKVKMIGVKGLIMKPMVMKDVARMIRNVLDNTN